MEHQKNTFDYENDPEQYMWIVKLKSGKSYIGTKVLGANKNEARRNARLEFPSAKIFSITKLI